MLLSAGPVCPSASVVSNPKILDTGNGRKVQFCWLNTTADRVCVSTVEVQSVNDPVWQTKHCVMVEQCRPVQSIHGGEWRTVTQKGGKSCQEQNPSRSDILGERGTKHVPEQKPVHDNSPSQHSTHNRYFVMRKMTKNDRIKTTQPGRWKPRCCIYCEVMYINIIFA